MRYLYSATQKAYTLIELLLYIAILGSLLISVTMYFATTADSRIKNQSISEVNQQGTAIMDRITQTLRNANAITAPATTACTNSLTVTVPTGVLSPTVFTTNSSGGSTTLGYNGTGTNTDSQNSNFIHATSFTATTSGIITTLNARVGATVAASPNNRGQMAIYSGATPTTLLASSGEIALTANAWNTFCIPPVTITAGTTYWLAYNSNGLTVNDNNLRFLSGTGQSRFVSQTYNTWPASWSGTTSVAQFSVYADVYTGTGTGTILAQEGAGGQTALTNSKVQVSGFAVQNLTRTGTPGAVRFSFVVSRVNPNNKNQFEYQKVFTGSGTLRWP